MKITPQVEKFLGLYILLLLLIPVTFLISSPKNQVGELRSKAATSQNRLYFWPSTASLKPNQDYNLQVLVETAQKPLNFDLVLSFDPNIVMISGNGAIPGNMYSTYQARFVDNQKGLAGLSGRGELQGGNVFETLKIHTKILGSAKITVNYLNASGLKFQTELPNLEVQ